MRLTEKENETLPIDVSDLNYLKAHSLLQERRSVFITISSPIADCITDPTVVCDDLLWNCPHCWRVQRHGCFLRAEKQVGLI